jgi:hypothetical protein
VMATHTTAQIQTVVDTLAMGLTAH